LSSDVEIAFALSDTLLRLCRWPSSYQKSHQRSQFNRAATVGVTGNPALEKLLANLYSRLDRDGNPFLLGDLSMNLGATSQVQLRAQSASARCSRFGGSIKARAEIGNC
jgi:hypothetical protein